MSRILLAVPALLPIAGGIALLVINHFRLRAGRMDGPRSYMHMGIFVEGVTLLSSLAVAWLVTHKAGGGESLVLFKLYGDLKVMFRLDGMGSVFAGLVAFLWPLAVLYSLDYMKSEERRGVFFSYYLMTYGVTVGIAFSGNLMTMYLFYELLTLVTFPLVLHPMTKDAVRASRKYLYYSIGGAAFAFIGIVFVLNFSASGNTQFVSGGILDMGAAGERRAMLLFAYVLAFFGFGVKAALFPCHGWLPQATVAPTPVTALLHAVAVVKSGAFAILRLTYFAFGTEFLWGTWAHLFVMGAVLATIIYGSTMAVKEIHWKRRLAYSTISNLSYILLGAVMMSPLGLAAALSHMVFHAFMKICSFFCAGAVMHRTGRTYVYELDGLGRRMPLTFACLTVASISLAGIPPFAGFISKWNIAQAAFDCGRHLGDVQGGAVWLPYAGVGVLLYSALMTAVYMFTVLIRAYFPKDGRGWGERTAETGLFGCQGDGAEWKRGGSGAEAGGCGREFKGRGAKGSYEEAGDPGWMMCGPLLVFAGAIILFGFFSAPLMRILMTIGGNAG